MVIKTLNEMLGKGEKATMTEAMIKNGYSRSYAESGQIRDKRTWQQLMEDYLPDSLLAKTHNDLLKADKVMVIKGEPILVPDNDVRNRATDMGYKVKGKMAPETFKIEDSRLENMSTQEIEELIAKKKAFFNKTD